MSDTYTRFADRFGTHNADIVLGASEQHRSIGFLQDNSNDDRGSDEFKYHLLVVIGYDCIMLPEYAKHHGFTVDPQEFKEWCRAEADLGSFEGTIPDIMSLLAGTYEEFIVRDDSTASTVEGEAEELEQ